MVTDFMLAKAFMFGVILTMIMGIFLTYPYITLMEELSARCNECYEAADSCKNEFAHFRYYLTQK
jgi:hypothetical protein